MKPSKVQIAITLFILLLMVGILGGYEAENKTLDVTFVRIMGTFLFLICATMAPQIHIFTSRKYNAFTRFWEGPVLRIKTKTSNPRSQVVVNPPEAWKPGYDSMD